MQNHSVRWLCQRSPLVVASRVLVVLILVGTFALQAPAQTGGHDGHHPGTPSDTPGVSAPANPAAPPSNTPADSSTTPPAGSSTTAPAAPGMGSGGAGMGSMMGDCMGGMCGMMGGRPRKEFYPSLMDFPTLSSEQRQGLEAQARTWISTGTDEIAIAESALRHANAAGDTVGAEQAASRLRQGLNQVSSGNTLLR